MASSLEFVSYVCEQIRGAGEITYKKMFGEYGLYCDGKIFGTVEDNQFCLKITKAGTELMPEAIIISPHEGARCFLIEELEDREFLENLIQRTCAMLPNPKPKSKRQGKTT